MITCIAAAAIFLSAAQAPVSQQPVLIHSQQETDGTHTLSHEVVVNASTSDVWTAVSTPEGWRTWAAPVARWSEGELHTLETSYAAAARPGNPNTIQQVFVARIPGRMLAFRTTRAPAGFPHFETYRSVTNVLELEPIGERRTRVRLTAVGYADTQAGRQLLSFFRDGNRVTLERLQSRFTQGPVDWSRDRSGSR